MPWIRDQVDNLPLPPGLHERIQSTIRRRRILRFTAFTAAAAAILVALTLRPHRENPPPPAIAFKMSLKTQAPESIRLQETQIETTVASTNGALVFTFMEPSHD